MLELQNPLSLRRERIFSAAGNSAARFRSRAASESDSRYQLLHLLYRLSALSEPGDAG